MSVRRTVVAVALAVAVVGLAAGAASAHVDADPLAMQQGTTAAVSFGVEHGCAGSNTTKLEMRFPDGFTAVKPVDKAGWQASVAGNVVTFAGGNLDAKTKGDFAVQVTAPTTAGTLYVPVVQTCVQGSTNWIEIPAAGAKEPELPAASIKITAGVPTADDLKAAPDDDAAATPATSSSKTGLVIGLVIAALVVAAGVVVVVRKRAAAPPAS